MQSPSWGWQDIKGWSQKPFFHITLVSSFPRRGMMIQFHLHRSCPVKGIAWGILRRWTHKQTGQWKEGSRVFSLQLHKAVFYIRCPSVFLLAHYKRMYLVKDQINCKMMNKNFKKKMSAHILIFFSCFYILRTLWRSSQLNSS